MGDVCSPGKSDCGTGALFNRPQRFTRDAIKDVKETVLRSQCDDVDHLAVMLHRRKLGRRVGIVVPNIVVNRLKVPKIFSGSRIQSKQAIGEKAVTRTVAAIQFVLGRCSREIYDAALLINRKFAPDVHPAHIFVSILGPGVVSHFARTRNRVEHPDQFSRSAHRRLEYLPEAEDTLRP